MFTIVRAIRDKLRNLEASGRSRGQILVLFALMLPAAVAVMGLGVDAAHLFVEQNNLQEAADLAALAGASQLPTTPTAAVTQAVSIAASNGFSSGVTTTTPTSLGDSTIPSAQKIQVQITETVKMWFLPVLGINSKTLTASAVAYRPPPSSVGPWIFFANRNDCSGSPSDPTNALYFNGGGDTYTGQIQSNGNIEVNGGSYKINAGQTGMNTYACKGIIDNGLNGGTYTLTKSSAVTMPALFTYASFNCNYTLSPSQSTLAAYTYPAFFNGQNIKDGVYCSTGDINLGWIPAGAHVTFVAKGRVALTGGLNLQPYQSGVLAYTESNGGASNPAFNTVGGGSTGSGIIYAPNGHAHILGGGFAESIAVYANTIDVIGGGNTFTKYSGAGGAAQPAKLIQ